MQPHHGVAPRLAGLPLVALVALVALVLGASACAGSVASGDVTDVSDASLALETGADVAADTASDGAGDAPLDAPGSAALCTGTFGNALPPGFVRIDGTVLAVVTPADTQCPRPNGTHVIVEVTAAGAVYRVVVNVASTATGVDPVVRHGQLVHALPPPEFADGIHPGVTLDYERTLGVHANTAPFVPTAMDALVRQLVAAIPVGAPVAMYSQGSGGDSTHNVHRNGSDDDGAIVLEPASASPRFLLFHFANQVF